ncbi:DUF2834 domain-containing protein [Iningainema sp. BLCCT55]|uniref:DUF2834 domain-containing protein n=1 Tax=Iningainema tapete BLCC-T55 TaxID=2748662 RepID=A0A8J6XFC1_9CYAN|nr:DUF2834 domain-containing protein [Iningainema tapete BLCC-T55]
MVAVAEVYQTDIGKVKPGQQAVITGQAISGKLRGVVYLIGLIVSSLVLWVFVFYEGSRLQMKNLWIYIASNLLGGVTLGLPLFLLMRQRKLEEKVFS